VLLKLLHRQFVFALPKLLRVYFKHDRALFADISKIIFSIINDNYTDQLNDAPALAKADMSITVYGGTDIAGDASDALLMRSDLTLIQFLVRLSRKTMRIIRENLVWAFAYNLCTVPLAALGIISPIIAAVAMVCSSLLVVGNSLRLRRAR